MTFREQKIVDEEIQVALAYVGNFYDLQQVKIWH